MPADGQGKQLACLQSCRNPNSNLSMMNLWEYQFGPKNSKRKQTQKAYFWPLLPIIGPSLETIHQYRII